jgi:hypothetical protein
VLDLRLYKWFVIGVLALYFMERRLPFILESLRLSVERPLDRRSSARDQHVRRMQVADMSFVERLVVVATILVYTLMPDSIRTFW